MSNHKKKRVREPSRYTITEAFELAKENCRWKEENAGESLEINEDDEDLYGDISVLLKERGYGSFVKEYGWEESNPLHEAAFKDFEKLTAPWVSAVANAQKEKKLLASALVDALIESKKLKHYRDESSDEEK